jgi:hypothetical protein
MTTTRPHNRGIWIVPAAILGGVVGLLISFAAIDISTSAAAARAPGQVEVTATGKLLGVTVCEETGTFATARTNVAQRMHTIAMGLVVTGMIAGAAAGLGLYTLARRRAA